MSPIRERTRFPGYGIFAAKRQKVMALNGVVGIGVAGGPGAEYVVVTLLPGHRESGQEARLLLEGLKVEIEEEAPAYYL